MTKLNRNREGAARTFVTYVLLLCAGPSRLNCAELTPAARQAFSRYVELFETTWKQSPLGGKRSRERAGDIVIQPRKTLDGVREIKPPGAMIQDWRGVMFLPNTNIEQVRAMMQDYKNYQVYFKPEVMRAKVIRHQGDDFEVFMRLYKKHILTVVLNTTYAIRFGSTDSRRMHITSRSTRVAEVKNPGRPSESEEPVGNDSGYLWALNAYWRFEEADGGVYTECEAISLSRDVPFGLGWAIKGVLEKFPKESMQSTLEGVKRAVAGRGPG